MDERGGFWGSERERELLEMGGIVTRRVRLAKVAEGSATWVEIAKGLRQTVPLACPWPYAKAAPMPSTGGTFWELSGLTRCLGVRYSLAMILKVVSFLFVIVCSQLIAATSYTIQPLFDNAQPGVNFGLNFPGVGSFPVNNTPYLAGQTSTGQAAIGRLNGDSFSFVALSPLPGGDQAFVATTLKDGSAIGFTATLSPNPNPIFPPLQTLQLTRWVNGVPEVISIADPNNPSAVIPPGPYAANSEGDIVGQYFVDGKLFLYRYNVLNGSFAQIATPEGVSFVVPFDMNAKGNILATSDLPGFSSLLLYDPTSASWKVVPAPFPLGFTGRASLNSKGDFVSEVFIPEFLTTLAYGYDGSTLAPLNQSGNPMVGGETVFGLNSAGVAIGAIRTRLGLFVGGEFLDLSPMISNPEGWGDFQFGVSTLFGINDSGQIFGNGVFRGTPTAFVLNPNESAEIPEPGTVLLTAAALGMLVMRRRG